VGRSAARQLGAPAAPGCAGRTVGGLLGNAEGERWESARVALIGRERSLAEVLAANRLVLRADLLRPWSRWVTPEFEPRRYDTYFFVAQLPVDQRARDVGGEASATAWVRPSDALTSGYLMLPPTTTTLRELSDHPDVASILRAADERDVATAVRPKFGSDQPNRPVM
jgi:hypothetical protein